MQYPRLSWLPHLYPDRNLPQKVGKVACALDLLRPFARLRLALSRNGIAQLAGSNLAHAGKLGMNKENQKVRVRDSDCYDNRKLNHGTTMRGRMLHRNAGTAGMVVRLIDL